LRLFHHRTEISDHVPGAEAQEDPLVAPPALPIAARGGNERHTGRPRRHPGVPRFGGRGLIGAAPENAAATRKTRRFSSKDDP